jgi:hypothetical protein
MGSVILNIFRLNARNDCCEDVLIGFHAMHLLIGNGHVSGWFGMLKKLGYNDDAIAIVEQRFREANLLHQIPDGRSLGPTFDFAVHLDVVHAYLDLIKEPAYLDNVALTTPVDPHFAVKMKPTVMFDSSQFAVRVTTTIEFLRFLAANEDQFIVNVRRRLGTNLGVLSHCELPSIVVAEAERYRERVSAIRETRSAPNIPNEEWWDDKLSDLARLTARRSKILRF